MAEITKRYAVVTGANKGIGFEICKQLASNGNGNGIIVVLTARDEKRGVEAVEKMKEFGLSDDIVFHQLDVTDPATVASLVEFMKTKFGKLHILVNNAGIGGVEADPQALTDVGSGKPGAELDWTSVLTQTPELAEQCLQTNYYGANRMCESLIHLLQLSDPPRIVNLSSSAGKLKNVSNEWARSVFSDAENLTEEKVDEVLRQHMKDLKGGPMETYKLSKAAMNAYTRILAKKYPKFMINSVCPGFVKTDIINLQ